MKRLIVLLASLASGVTCAQQANNWENSPNNWNNSSNNWNNSSNNWENSPNNWKNSSNNFNSQNGVYDNQGNRQGYQVQSPTGVVNYFDNKGIGLGMRLSNKRLSLFTGLLLLAPICFGESIYLKCNGTANKSSIMGDASSFPFSTSIELDEQNKYIDISNILDVAPGIGYPFQTIYFRKDKILFFSKKEVPGDFVDIKGEINRFTEEATINYTNINPKSADKILTIKISLICKVAPSRKF